MGAKYLEPLFTEPGVPDDEILLAEALAEIGRRGMEPTTLTRGYIVAPPEQDDPGSRCCIIGALDRSRGRHIECEELPGAMTGNDCPELDSSPDYVFFDLGAAYIGSLEAE